MVGSFFDFFVLHWQGILVFGLLLLTIALLVQWFAWIFSWGRFQRRDPPSGRQALRYLFAELLVKIIDDFRHFLALVIVVIFGLALTYSLVLAAYEQSGPMDAIAKALQAVVSALGGLIGAIIGYYFGEKAGEKSATAQTPAQASAPTGPAAQMLPPSGTPAVPSVQQAPAPPGTP